jgi:hypothetical protein
MLKRHVINKHAPQAKKPQTRDEFSYFLAGLIDGDGSIDKKGNIIICFHSRDISVAYYVKKVVGHGHVRKIKNKNAWIYNCTNNAGNVLIVNLIWDKIRHPNRILQLNPHMSSAMGKDPRGESQIKCGDTKPFDLSNHWLAGFLQADGSFQVKILNKICVKNASPKCITEVRVVIQLDQKKSFLLQFIKDHLGGYIGYRAKQDTYYYSSTSFYNCVQWIHYLDKFQVTGSSLTLYWMWRKCYLLVQEKKHLDSDGLEKIQILKHKMTRLRKGSLDLIP